MTMNSDSNQTAQETAFLVAELVRTRQQLTAAGVDMTNLDEKMKPYKTMYIRAGAKYGGNHAGIVQWFHERAQETPVV